MFTPQGNNRDNAPIDSLESARSVRWWREWQFFVLAVMAIAIYFSRIVDLPIRGEETRRAMVAWEILQTGDWIVPRQQGELFLSRPPIGSWPIAWLTSLTGELSLVAIRLPTILATVLTALLVYAYSRNFLNPIGAFSSGLAYATFAQVLQLGRVAETEAIFTLFLSGGLILWHWGYCRKWPLALMWSIAYALVAIAALTKSLQAPVYFAGAIGFYLLWQRDWNGFATRGHAVGLFVFALIFGAWQIPFFCETNWNCVQKIWASDVGLRLEQLSFATVVRHFATFPLQVWACLLPWALLLPAYLWPQFRRTIGAARPMVAFAVICWLVSLPTCWLVPNAKPRYLMPLFPLAAPLVGLVVQRVYQADAAAIVRRGWNWFTAGMIAAIGCGAAVFVAAGRVPSTLLGGLSQPVWFGVIYASAAIIAIAVLLRTWNQWSARGAIGSILAIAMFAGLTASGAVVNSLVALDPDAQQQVAELARRIPEGKPLGSFGLVETIFSYYWRRPIDYVRKELPDKPSELPAKFEYFCYCGNRNDRVELPFPWRVEGIINCDRTLDSSAGKVVVVGRRLATVALLPETKTKTK